ncbi:unnamed protein product, partial [Didymodactylos carnosus]
KHDSASSNDSGSETKNEDENEKNPMLKQLIRIALCNLLWSVSFHNQYKNEMRENDGFMNTVKYLAANGEVSLQQFVPKHLSSIKKAADGILWNLNESIPGAKPKSFQKSTPENTATTNISKTPLVMISYSHEDDTFCRNLDHALIENAQLDAWTDYKDNDVQLQKDVSHTDNLWENIANVMEASDIILLLITKDYFNSNSCRQEAEYPKYPLKKRIIPIYLTNDYEARGWLGIMIAGQKHIRFGRKTFDSTIIELIKRITDCVPAKTTIQNRAESARVTTCASRQQQPRKSVDHWTLEDINHWFSLNHIQPELRSLFTLPTGTAMVRYADYLKCNDKKEYEAKCTKFEDKYHKKLDADQFFIFEDALCQLSDEYGKMRQPSGQELTPPDHPQPSQQRQQPNLRTSRFCI